jgi:hypothetical protein
MASWSTCWLEFKGNQKAPEEDRPAPPQHILVQIRRLLLWTSFQEPPNTETLVGADDEQRAMDDVVQTL